MNKPSSKVPATKHQRPSKVPATKHQRPTKVDDPASSKSDK